MSFECKLINDIQRLKFYTINDYIFDVENVGLEITWKHICDFVLEYPKHCNEILNIENFGELYENEGKEGIMNAVKIKNNSVK